MFASEPYVHTYKVSPELCEQMSKKMSHYYVEKQENVVAIWMCSQLLMEDLEKIDVFVKQSLGIQIGIIFDN